MNWPLLAYVSKSDVSDDEVPSLVGGDRLRMDFETLWLRRDFVVKRCRDIHREKFLPGTHPVNGDVRTL